MSPTNKIIDVSNNNGVINWDQAHADGVVLAWAKATQGLTFLDQYLQSNLAAMRRLGIQDGTYHYANPANDATQEADWYVDNVLKAGGFGVKEPVLDIEETGGLNKAQLTAWMLTWLNRVEQRTARVPAIYCSTSFASTSFDSTQFSRYPLWLASYGASSPGVPLGWAEWSYWQYTDSGSVAGVDGSVDMNYLKGEVPPMAQTLMQGSSGDAVKTLQTDLKKLLNLGDSFVVDGQYGPATAAAVKSFQLQNHLTIDGIAGPQTLSAIDTAIKLLPPVKPATPATQAKPTTTEPTPTPAPAPTAETVTIDKTKLAALQLQLQNTLASVEALIGGNN